MKKKNSCSNCSIKGKHYIKSVGHEEFICMVSDIYIFMHKHAHTHTPLNHSFEKLVCDMRACAGHGTMFSFAVMSVLGLLGREDHRRDEGHLVFLWFFPVNRGSFLF